MLCFTILRRGKPDFEISENENEYVSLSGVNLLPVHVTFLVFGNYFIVDPTSKSCSKNDVFSWNCHLNLVSTWNALEKLQIKKKNKSFYTSAI